VVGGESGATLLLTLWWEFRKPGEGSSASGGGRGVGFFSVGRYFTTYRGRGLSRVKEKKGSPVAVSLSRPSDDRWGAGNSSAVGESPFIYY